jgi:hypothetical protein
MTKLLELLKKSPNWPGATDIIEDYYVAGPLAMDDLALIEVGIKFAKRNGFTVFTIPLDAQFITSRRELQRKRSTTKDRNGRK